MQNDEKTSHILQHQRIEAGIAYQAERDLGTFFRKSWKILEPTTPLLTNWHQDLIAEYLMACYKRQIKRLIINMPPRYAKSNECTVAFPAWVWTQDPSVRFITASYADNLATKHSVDRRTLLESDWYRKSYGDRFKLSSDQNVKSEFTNDKRGAMYATGLSGAVTGKGCNILIVDDPHDAQKVHSDAVRKNDILSFDQKFTTRLDNKKEDVIIVVMQRLHEQDLTGHLLERGGWEHLCLPGIAEKETLVTFPVSGRQILREKDSYLHEEREGEFEMEANKKTLGSQGFAAQIQQAPSPEGGVMVDPRWFKFYKSLDELPRKFHQVLQSWDMTFKDTKTSDYVCGQVWGRFGSNAYLFPFVIHERLDFPKTIEKFKTLTLRYPEATLKIVEDKANGPAVISSLRSKIAGIVPYSPKDSKEGRLSAVSPMIEAGQVWLPDPSIAPWIVDFLLEVSKFPNGANDDYVDAMTQALLRFFESMRYDLEAMTQF
jgi:predicted phage terminase large subunit-like protein